MKFTGISKVFSTVGEKQYATIGAFWDEMAARYGRANLRGLGYHWSSDSIEYVIGSKDGVIDGTNCKVYLPDGGWGIVKLCIIDSIWCQKEAESIPMSFS